MTAKIRNPLHSLPMPTANGPPEPDETAPLLNLDVHGNPLTYKTAKAGPDKAHWEKAGGDEITRLITSSTIFPIPKHRVPANKWRDIVYYNPVVKQKIKNGIVEFRVRGTAGGDRLTVPYDVSARTANLEVVKILIHSTISTKIGLQST